MSGTSNESGSTALPNLDMNGALEKIGNDRELYQELAVIYLRETPGIIRDLKAALCEGDKETACLRAHSLKSTTRTMGGLLLGNHAAKIEYALGNDRMNEASRLFEGIELEYSRIVESLQTSGLGDTAA